MAKMRNGVFSNPSGKIGGVIFSRWKSVDYGRAYTIPANPQSVAQTAQRTKMTDCVSFARELVYTILNRLYDPFERNRSAYNTFVSKNIANFGQTVAYQDIVLGNGSLFPAEFDGAIVYTSGTKTMTVSFSDAVGFNGAGTDQVTLVAYNQDTGKFFYSYEGTARSTGENTVVIDDATLGDIVWIWIITYSEANGVITAVSPSRVSFKEVTA
jgi:hypothetical protein